MDSEFPRQAMVLAAGRGERLRPFTDRVPKCMVHVAGKPILQHTIEWLASVGVHDLMINLHHLPDVIADYFRDGVDFGVRISYSREERLLGTAGAVRRAGGHFRGPFFVWYGDNISRCDLQALWARHRSLRAVATMAMHHRDDPTQSGIIGTDEAGYVTRFAEKPRREEVFSRWVNAGILVIEPAVVAGIEGEVADFSRDVFPRLLERGQRLGTYVLSAAEGLWWFDTPDDLRACAEALARHRTASL